MNVVHSLRTIARTPWGFMGYVETVIDDLDPVTLEEAKKRNLRDVQDRLTPSATFPGHQPLTPVGGTPIIIAETLVTQDPLGAEEDDVLQKFEEYEIPFWKMAG